MSFTPTAGNAAIAKIGSNTIPGINWKLNIDPKLTSNASNFRDGRVKIATLLDASVTIRLVWDSADPPTLSSGLNIRPGESATILCYVDGTNFWSVPSVIGPIGPENAGLEDVVMMDVTFEFSGSAVTYPANG